MSKKAGRTSDLRSKADAAFRQAAKKIIEQAKRTGTPVVVWRNGRIRRIPADQIEAATVESPPKSAGL